MNYTSISQSKQLIEAGLDPNTADMYFQIFDDGITTNPQVFVNTKFEDLKRGYNWQPCWSLEALIGLMPAYITTNYTIGSNLFIQRVGNSYGESGFRIYYKLDENAAYTDFITSYDYKNLIDAAFETVLWLLENNYIKKKK